MVTMGYTAMQQSNTRLSMQQWFLGLVAWSATMATMGYTAMQQVCTSLQTDNHASTPPLSFLQAGCPSCRPTNSFKPLKAILCPVNNTIYPTETYKLGSVGRN